MDMISYYQEKARYWASVAMYARDTLGQKSTCRDAQENAAHYAEWAREMLAFRRALDAALETCYGLSRS